MPETVLPQTPATPKAPPSSTPPGGTPTSATPSPQAASETAATPPPTSAPSADWRYPDSPDVPTWARGKSPMEVLQVTRGYEEAND